MLLPKLESDDSVKCLNSLLHFPNPCLRTRKGKETWLKQHEINHAENGSKAHFTLGLLSFFQLEYRAFLWLGCWQIEKKTNMKSTCQKYSQAPFGHVGFVRNTAVAKNSCAHCCIKCSFYSTLWHKMRDVKQTNNISVIIISAAAACFLLNHCGELDLRGKQQLLVLL